MDDTIILVDASFESLWTIKAILCAFELTSDVRVNFSKISLIGVNSNPDFLELACGFLHYEQGSLPFKYIGLPVRENPRLSST